MDSKQNIEEYLQENLEPFELTFIMLIIVFIGFGLHYIIKNIQSNQKSQLKNKIRQQNQLKLKQGFIASSNSTISNQKAYKTMTIKQLKLQRSQYIEQQALIQQKTEPSLTVINGSLSRKNQDQEDSDMPECFSRKQADSMVQRNRQYSEILKNLAYNYSEKESYITWINREDQNIIKQRQAFITNKRKQQISYPKPLIAQKKLQPLDLLKKNHRTNSQIIQEDDEESEAKSETNPIDFLKRGNSKILDSKNNNAIQEQKKPIFGISLRQKQHNKNPLPILNPVKFENSYDKFFQSNTDNKNQPNFFNFANKPLTEPHLNNSLNAPKTDLKSKQIEKQQKSKEIKVQIQNQKEKKVEIQKEKEKQKEKQKEKEKQLEAKKIIDSAKIIPVQSSLIKSDKKIKQPITSLQFLEHYLKYSKTIRPIIQIRTRINNLGGARSQPEQIYKFMKSYLSTISNGSPEQIITFSYKIYQVIIFSSIKSTNVKDGYEKMPPREKNKQAVKNSINTYIMIINLFRIIGDRGEDIWVGIVSKVLDFLSFLFKRTESITKLEDLQLIKNGYVPLQQQVTFLYISRLDYLIYFLFGLLTFDPKEVIKQIKTVTRQNFPFDDQLFNQNNFKWNYKQFWCIFDILKNNKLGAYWKIIVWMNMYSAIYLQIFKYKQTGEMKEFFELGKWILKQISRLTKIESVEAKNIKKIDVDQELYQFDGEQFINSIRALGVRFPEKQKDLLRANAEAYRSNNSVMYYFWRKQ